jgi:lipopolysaccharide export system permease protein
VTFFLSLNFLLDYLDLFISKGIPLLTVVRLYVLGLGWMLALSIPCAVLVGVLMTYGRMAQDNEIVAMEASGISLGHILGPTLAASFIIAVGLTLFNNYILPETNHAFANLMVQINKARPTARIQEGVFIDDFPGYRLFIGRLDDRSGRMRDVLIFDTRNGIDKARTIMAREGALRYEPERGLLTLVLENGEIHEAVPGEETTYRRMRFRRQTLLIKDPQAGSLPQKITRSRGQREMSVAQMKAKIRELAAEADRLRQQRDAALDSLGLSSIAMLPGAPAHPKSLWERALPWLRKRPPELPDSVSRRLDRRWVEEARMRELQVQATEKRMDQYRVEIHKKFSIPAACIVFVLLGAPLGIKARRGGLAAGFLSVGFFLFYYLSLVGGEQLADRALLAPWLSMWLPNIVLGLVGLPLTLKVCHLWPWRRQR